MQASEVANGFDSRPQIKMIGIAQKNLDAEFFENVLRDSFNSSSSAYWHEHWSFDLAMRRTQATAAGRAGVGLNSELNGHCLRL